MHKKYESFPAETKFKRILDKIIYPIAILGPIAVMPQAMKIWTDKIISGVAIETWLLALFISWFWLAYGIAHREKPIIIAQIFYMILHISIISGIIFHS